jgi:hypothetical protein
MWHSDKRLAGENPGKDASVRPGQGFWLLLCCGVGLSPTLLLSVKLGMLGAVLAGTGNSLGLDSVGAIRWNVGQPVGVGNVCGGVRCGCCGESCQCCTVEVPATGLSRLAPPVECQFCDCGCQNQWPATDFPAHVLGGASWVVFVRCVPTSVVPEDLWRRQRVGRLAEVDSGPGWLAWMTPEQRQASLSRWQI